jgi:rRNA processing protein Gar1
VPLGIIESLVEGVIVVRSLHPHQVYDAGTLLTLENRHSLGLVEDVIGPVSQPFYTVRLDKSVNPTAAGIFKGSSVFVASSMSVIAQPDRSKGCDASNVDDEEIAFVIRGEK